MYAHVSIVKGCMYKHIVIFVLTACNVVAGAGIPEGAHLPPFGTIVLRILGRTCSLRLLGRAPCSPKVPHFPCVLSLFFRSFHGSLCSMWFILFLSGSRSCFVSHRLNKLSKKNMHLDSALTGPIKIGKEHVKVPKSKT